MREDGRQTISLDVHALGIWGGTLDVERQAVRHLPIDAAARELERTFPARMRRGVAAFRRELPKGPQYIPKGPRARILNLLEDRPLAVTALRRCCAGCTGRLPALARSDARYCSVRCRVAAHRAQAA